MTGALRHLLSFALGMVIAAGVVFLTWRQLADKQVKLLGRRVQILADENERLRALVEQTEREKVLAKSKAQRVEVERAVEAIRGLEFKQPVNYEVLDRTQLKATLSRKLTELYSEEEFQNLTAAFVRLGLLPEGYPLREKYLDLLGEQVAAFFDQHTHKLYMFADASLDNAQNRVVLAHELTHALQDQHFGLKRLPLESKTNDDRAIAASALCEGDATLVMSEYMLKNLSLASLKDNLSAAMTQNMEQLAKAPRFLREMLIFPYLRGQEFCSALYARGGYAAVTVAYEQPPSSSAQILHPEKYLAQPREEPVQIEWAKTDAYGKKPIADNTLGEMGIRVLLSEWGDAAVAEKAAAGWRGDRYLCFDKGDALVWRSVWETPEEAGEFAAAMKAALAKRYGAESTRLLEWRTPTPTERVLIDVSDEAMARTLEERFAR